MAEIFYQKRTKKTIKCIVACLFLFNIIAVPLKVFAKHVHYAGGIVYVNKGAPANGDGSSWSSPLKEFRDAVTIATSDPSVQQIWVAAGTYTPTTGTDRTVSFSLPGGISVYGGFNGTEANLTDRNVAANLTILSGDIGITGNKNDNSYNVVTITNTTNPVALDGFTISGANNTNNMQGGGLWINQNTGAITLNQLTITNNTAELGAGVGIEYSGSVNITQLVISNNTANSGDAGGMEVFNSVVTLTNSVFDGNISQNGNGTFAEGGGLELDGTLGGGTTVTCNNCVFNNNRANNKTFVHGGAIMNFGGTLNLTNCTLYNNMVSSAGFSGSNGVTDEGNDDVTALNFINTIIWSTAQFNLAIDESKYAASVNLTNCDIAGTNYGGANISTDPLFTNPKSPVGADGIWGTADDGLMLSCLSPAHYTGTSNGATATDILGTGRPNPPDMGAYQQTGTPVPPSITISISSGGNCPGVPIEFTATTTSSGANPKYQWQVNGNNEGTNSPTINFSKLNPGDVVSCQLTTDYTVCVTTLNASSNTIKINSLPKVNASIIKTVNAGSPYLSQQITATGGATPYSFAVTTGALPNGITLGSDGTLFGTSDVPGSYQFTVQVTENACGNIATRQFSADINGLSSLTLNTGVLNPLFDPGTTSYSLSVPNATSSISVTPTAGNQNAKITVNNNAVITGHPSPLIALKVGDNTITIKETAQDLVTVNTYTITVTRTPSSDATLKNIHVSAGSLSPVFTSGNTSYTDNVPNSISSINVTPTTSDPTATVTVNGNTVSSGSPSQDIQLNVGANTITTFVTAQDGVTTNTYTITVNRAPSGVATLSNLYLSNGTLNPNFAPGVINYTATVSNSTTSVNITPTTTDPNATVTVNGAPVSSGSPSGDITLNIGANIITMVVTAQNGTTTRTYTVTVNRAKSSVATLNNLAISSGTLNPNFDSGTTSYSDAVDNSVSSVTVTPTVTDPTVSIKVNGLPVTSGSASSPITLSVGNNTITTKITAQDGTINTYTITVNRALSSIATLSNLTVSQGTLSPSFFSFSNNYTDEVGNTITSVKISPTATDPTAKITVNGTAVSSGYSIALPLTVGQNFIYLVVTAQDGTTNTYTVNVTRDPSTVATLTRLSINHGTLTPAFSPGTTDYTDAVVNTTTSVAVTPTVTDPTATITVNGSSVASGSPSNDIPLNVGDNTITTIVTAQDGSTTDTYTITVTRAPSTVATLSSLTISDGTLTPTFTAAHKNYNDVVAFTTNAVTVNPTTTDPTATITVNGSPVSSGSDSDPIALNVGANTITTVVTAQDGATMGTYTITVTRSAPSTIATLVNLAVSDGILTPSFTPSTTSYTDNVSNATSSITVTPTVTDVTASITINGVAVASGSPSAPIALNIGSNIITTVITAQDGTTTDTYTLTVIRAASSNANLVSLAVSNGTLSPSFDPGTTNYTDAVDNSVSSITVTPTVADPTATIIVNGSGVSSGSASAPILLNVGANTITTVVTAQDGTTTNAYTIVVNRAPSANASLVNLSVSNGTLSPAFDAGTMNYTDNVDNAVTSIAVTPTVSDPTATITVNGSTVSSGSASAPISLNVGDNTIATVVTAQDGITTTTYTIVVTRAPSSNASLTNLTISSGVLNPAFNANTSSYTDTVASSVTSVTITPTVSDPNATITVNGVADNSGTPSAAIALNTGDNVITTTITAQDGITTQTYIIIVSKGKATQTITFNPLSPVPYGTPDFDPGATASSGLPIIYTTDNVSVATIVNGKVHITGTGNVTITASVADDPNYFPATAVSQTLTVNKGDQSLTSITIPVLLSGSKLDLSGIKASSGLPVSFSVSDPTITAIKGDTLIALQLGTVTLTASQAGNNFYNAVDSTYTITTVVVDPDDQLIVHQALTPNGDGINDFFLIEGIKNYPDNTVTVANRNGVKVYSARGYDNESLRFDGHSNITNEYQPAGTYFYLIDYITNGKHRRKAGFLVLKY